MNFMCFCKGFDIQMKGPDLVTDTSNGTQTRGSSDKFRTIQHHPGSVRSADIFNLNPKSTYRFRVIPKALTTEGEPSGIYRIGPGMVGLRSDCQLKPIWFFIRLILGSLESQKNTWTIFCKSGSKPYLVHIESDGLSNVLPELGSRSPDLGVFMRIMSDWGATRMPKSSCFR